MKVMEYPWLSQLIGGKRTLVSNDSGLKEIHGDLVIAVAPSVNDFSLGIASMWEMNKGLVIKNKTWKQAAQELHDIVLQQQ